MEDFVDLFSLLINSPTLVQVFAIVFVTMLANYFARKFFDRMEETTLQTVTIWDDALLHSVRRPLSLLIWVLGFSWAAELISVEAEAGEALADWIEPVRYISVIALFALFFSQFIRECENGFIKKGADLTTAHAVGKLLRVSVFITASLTVLQTLGISISGILAFGGVGGIAVGFAAKDILANFFGGLMIYLDRPFSVGDWVRSPDREIEGTVERIGWRLTVIRTFDRRPLYIPNSVFAYIAVENPSRMQNRRIYETIGLRYSDASKVRMIVDDVRKLLQNHEEIDSQQTLIVNFDSFAPSSLDFFVYAFTRTTDWVEFHSVKERILLEIYEIIVSHSAEVAFPTSTIQFDAQAEPQIKK
jgi:MscS family membrane protein